MEPFGLLKILQSALFPSSESSEPTPPPKEEAEENPPAFSPQQEEKNSNAFLELVKRHDEISKNISKKK